jgi:hypothetical protein
LNIIDTAIKPRNKPDTEKTQPNRFIKNVEGRICMIINKGMNQPENNRIRAKVRRKREFVMVDVIRVHLSLRGGNRSMKNICFDFMHLAVLG